MKILKSLMILGLIALNTQLFSQELPESYQPMLNEIVTNFESIRGANTITKGSTTLGVVNKKKVTLYLEYKKQVKNLVFEKGVDENNSEEWIAANQITIDMVNKHEEDLTKELETMYKLSAKKAKE
ncbi:MAG: hypothetical protein JXB49_16075 [Bacteroidales bacterium]|nr:hypothetical protein [Bacteroidales bacterium]